MATRLFASEDESVPLIGAARQGLYRDWVLEHYRLDRQVDRVLAMLSALRVWLASA